MAGGMPTMHSDFASILSNDGHAKSSMTGKVIVELPFDLIHGVPVARVTVNKQRDKLFLIDSGSISLIDRSEATKVGARLSPKSGQDVMLYGLGYTEGIHPLDAKPIRIELGSGKSLLIKGDVFAVDLSAYGRELGITLSGIIGYDIIRQWPILIDYPHKRIVIYKRNSITMPEGLASFSLVVDPKSVSPVAVIEACISDKAHCGAANVEIDTGNQMSAEIYDNFASKYRLRELKGWQAQSVLTFVQPVSIVHGKDAWLQVRNGRIEVPDVALANREQASPQTDPFDISLGSAVLSRGEVLFDVGSGRIYLIDIADEAPNLQ
jgi:hypothetical protein